MVIKKGDIIKVEYEGSLDDGSIFDSTEKYGEKAFPKRVRPKTRYDHPSHGRKPNM